MTASVCSMYSAMPKTPKVATLQLRIAPHSRMEFKIACELLGSSMSTELHRFVFRTISQVKEKNPEAFTLTAVTTRMREEAVEEAARKGKAAFTEVKQLELESAHQTDPEAEEPLLIEANVVKEGMTKDQKPHPRARAKSRAVSEVEDQYRSRPADTVKENKRKTS